MANWQVVFKRTMFPAAPFAPPEDEFEPDEFELEPDEPLESDDPELPAPDDPPEPDEDEPELEEDEPELEEPLSLSLSLSFSPELAPGELEEPGSLSLARAGEAASATATSAAITAIDFCLNPSHLLGAHESAA